MAEAQTGCLVFKEGTGRYVAIPQELWEQCRVPQERRAELETRLREAADEDVAGYAQSLTFAGAVATAMNDLRDGDFARGLILLGTALKAQSTHTSQSTGPLPA